MLCYDPIIPIERFGVQRYEYFLISPNIYRTKRKLCAKFNKV